jgi:hypothetical protein
MAIVGWKILSDKNVAQRVCDVFENDKSDREQDVELDQFGLLPGA